MKYLYYRGRYTDRSVYRSIVTRETEHNYWIKSGHVETKISKKTMSDGDTWSKTYYNEETPELLEKYKFSVLKRRFIKKLDDLRKIEDIKIMKQR